MHRSLTLLISFTLLSTVSLPAQKEAAWLSLNRLSVSTNAAYHYAPWKAYNTSLSLAQDAIRYSPQYPNPSGQLERILGDASYDVTFAYRIVSSFSLVISAGILRVESNDSFRYILANPVYVNGATILNGERSIQQDLAFNTPHFGLGMRYTAEVTSVLQVSVSAVVEKYSGSLRFNYRDEFPGYVNLYDADLKQSRLGARVACTASLAFDKSFSIIAGIDYRWLKFPNLNGDGTYTSTYSNLVASSHPFNAQLGEGGGYFGLYVSDDQFLVSPYILHSMWSGSAALPWSYTRPTGLDLSGVGMTIGFQYAF
jgi:hypothetical protein